MVDQELWVIVRRQRLLRTLKNRNIWRAMTASILKGNRQFYILTYTLITVKKIERENSLLEFLFLENRKELNVGYNSS